MKNLILTGVNLFVLLCTAPVFGQYEQAGWLFGGGFNFIDDSGTSGDQPFDFDDNWSSVVFPSRFSLGYSMTNGLFIQGFASYNKYRKDTWVNGTSQTDEWNYYALDGMIGYGFKNLIDRRGWFDPFVNTGLGIKRLAGSNDLTYNLGGGFNFWFNESLALNLSTLGKWTLGDTSGDNHIQHGIGIIFKPDLRELFSKKDNEEPQVLASSETTDEQQDTTLLASTENLTTPANPQKVPPKPTKATVKPEKNKTLNPRELKKVREEKMKQDLASVHRIAYQVNSSFLQESDREKLGQLVAYLNYYPTAVLEIRGNVDPRGTEEYNAWLSVRRANRIKDYLIATGISPKRIKAVGSIENEAEGPCANGKPCSEKELEESRRVEYILLDF